ncbi:hypothetical protein ACET3Z_025913 [Daucus carota]
MDGSEEVSSTFASLPPPLPKSPPDLFGKRRELAMLQMLHTKMASLQEELESVGRIQTASLSCKEVADFVIANADPLVTVSHKVRRPHWIWRWLCGKYSCFNLSRICCCCGCFLHYRQSDCSTPKSQSCMNTCWPCCGKSYCCDCGSPSCPDCPCSGVWSML